MGWRRDEQGAMAAFEAVMVAILVMTAILFVTATNKPVLETTGTGLDPNELADTMLADLEITAIDLEGAVKDAVGGNSQPLESAMGPVLAKFPGFRYALRLDNGMGVLQLAPSGDGVLNTPRGAGGSSVFTMPSWTSGLGTVTELGGPLNWSDWDGVCFDDGAGGLSALGPGETPWLEIWESMEPTKKRAPTGVPLGTWSEVAALLNCNNPLTKVDLVVPGEGVIARPVYGLQLLIWDGAGT